MTPLSRRALLVLALPASLALTPAASAATTLRGVVVHRDARSHSFVLAVPGGRLVALHSRRSPRIGTTLSASARRLRNGTFSLSAVHPRGHARRARLQGTVTYVDRSRGIFTLSARGASILIHRGRAHGARFALASAATVPVVGEQVTVTATLTDGGEVDAESVLGHGQDTNGLDVHGVVLSVDPQARTLEVSADDSEESGAALKVTVPSTLDLTLFSVGQEVDLQVLPQADGSNLLQGSALDGNSQQADGQVDEQGNQGDDQGDQQDGGGDHATSSDGQDSHGDGHGSSSDHGGPASDHTSPPPTGAPAGDHGSSGSTTAPPLPASGDGTSPHGGPPAPSVTPRV